MPTETGLVMPGDFQVPRPPEDQARRDTLRARARGPWVLRTAGFLLREIRPVLRIGRHAIVTRHADVREILEQPDCFRVGPTHGRRMDALGLNFILGMDPGSRYERERSWLEAAIRSEDRRRLRADVRGWCEALLDRADPTSVDLSTQYARMLGLRLAEAYLGVPGPEPGRMLRWMRTLFHHLFLDLGEDTHRAAEAQNAAAGLEYYLLETISARRETRAEEPEPSDVLGRLILASEDEKTGLDDDAIRRGISGLVIGAVETTNTAFCNAMDVLLSNRRAFRAARQAALAADVASVGRYVFEALRFRPHNPILVRTARHDYALRSGAGRIRAGDTVYVSNLSAMFDPRAFFSPGTLRVDRDVPYLHFGAGMHACFGSAINQITLPEMATVLLRRPGLRRDGRLRGQLHFDGPFPDQLRVRFRR